MKTLIAITTYNNNVFTEAFLKSIKKLIESLQYEIIIFDDHSQQDNVRELADRWKIRFYSTDKPENITYLWNTAYKIFKYENYDYCFICNNDVVGTEKAFENMVDMLKHPNINFVVPLSSCCGAGSNRIYQDIDLYVENIPSDYSFIEKLRGNKKQYYSQYTKKIQDILESSQCISHIIPTFLGFLFGFSRQIIQCEYAFDVLFNPQNICVGQEQDLCNRLSYKHIPITLCKNSYFYHFKRASYLKDGKGKIILPREKGY